MSSNETQAQPVNGTPINIDAAIGAAQKTATCVDVEKQLDFDPMLRFMGVTHIEPDTDAICGLWYIKNLADEHYKGEGDAFEYRFVRSGERLPAEECDGFNVVHVDTGLGRFDQHALNLVRGSSFQLLVEAFAMSDDPGIVPILELTRATDNVEQVDPCSIHNVFKALRGLMKMPDGKTDWDKLMPMAFTMLNALYSFHVQKAHNDAQFDPACIETLKSGVKFAILWDKPYLKDAAFERGADVVLWFQRKSKGFWVGLQCNRTSKVKLTQAAAELRREEGRVRKISPLERALFHTGTLSALPTWFLHKSENLILSGSKTHPLQKGEYSLLTQRKIVDIAWETLSR